MDYAPWALQVINSYIANYKYLQLGLVECKNDNLSDYFLHLQLSLLRN